MAALTATGSTRQRLIDTAADLFYCNGFHAVGLDRILAEVGVTKTTFYNHFGSKDDLIVAVLQHRDVHDLAQWLAAIRERAGECPRAQLLAFFDVLREWLNSPDCRGCMFINAAAQFPSPHDPAHRAAAAHHSRVLDEVRARAELAGAAAPDEFARQFVLLLEGAIILWQMTRDDQAANVARAAAEVLMDYYFPPPEPPQSDES